MSYSSSENKRYLVECKQHLDSYKAMADIYIAESVVEAAKLRLAYQREFVDSEVGLAQAKAIATVNRCDAATNRMSIGALPTTTASG